MPYCTDRANASGRTHVELQKQSFHIDPIMYLHVIAKICWKQKQALKMNIARIVSDRGRDDLSDNIRKRLLHQYCTMKFIFSTYHCCTGILKGW